MAVDDKTMYLDQTDEKYGPLFDGGHVGMIITGPWQLYDLVQAKTPYGVTILPGTNGDHQTISGPDIWALFDHKDANRAYWTFELLKWLSQPEQDARWNMALGNLPLRASETGHARVRHVHQGLPGRGRDGRRTWPTPSRPDPPSGVRRAVALRRRRRCPR